MALLWVDGWDQYGTTVTATAVGFQARYPIATVPTNPIVRAGRLFGNSISNSSGTVNLKLMTPNLGNMQTVIVGGAYNFDNVFTDRLIVLWEADGVTEGFNLRLTSGGALAAYRGGTLLDTSGVVISTDTWYYIEIKVRVGNAGTGNYEVRVNGVDVLSDTDADTQVGSNDYANRVEWYVRISNNCHIDDTYVCDGTGSKNNNFLGDSRVETLFPTADGASEDFTPTSGSDNYAMVDDEATGLDSDTTYVESSTPDDRDTYSFTDLSTIDLVRGVQLTVIARKTDVTDYDIELVLDTTAQSPITVNDTNYSSYSQIYEDNPGTASPWLDSEINGSEFGYEVG
jgi:hypothetical protein